MNRLALVILVLLSSKIWAYELIFAYGPGNGAPFSIIEDGVLKAGLFKDIGDRLASELKVKVTFKHTPHKRTSLLLADGEINSVCLANPDWIEGSEYLFWSDKILEDFDHLIYLNRQKKIVKYSDIHGMTIGTMTGYIYFPELMAKFNSGKAIRRDMNSLDSLYGSLYAKRIDALVDSQISVRYRKKISTPNKDFSISELTVFKYDLYCAFNSSLKPHEQVINKAIRDMIKRDEFKNILKSYQ